MSGGSRFYRCVAWLAATLLRLQGYRFDIQGTENIPTDGPGVLAANHQSFIDFILVGYAARQRGRLVRFMAKQALFDLPLAGRAMRRMGHVPVTRGSGALPYRRARDWIDRGELVGVFPEGTISRSWLIKPLRPGAAGLSLSRGVPLIPVISWGGHRIFSVDGHRSLRRRIPVTIRVGEPLTPDEGEGVPELTDRLRVALTALLDQAIEDYPDQPKNDADRWWLPHTHGGAAPDPETAHALDVAAVERLGDIIE
ncbi:MAG: lysophospholipid acyltransferase family protein [Aeromicrobium sp.]|uniref:lysophospholipid acyltransferase family protein n=1 Tax=Aeromicrobium sp. TaxID=1871063 RepID=UPI0039E534F6